MWDATTGQGFSQYIEHQKRAWSVDFSQVDPMKFATGSDDCSVKLWNINEVRSLLNHHNPGYFSIPFFLGFVPFVDLEKGNKRKTSSLVFSSMLK